MLLLLLRRRRLRLRISRRGSLGGVADDGYSGGGRLLGLRRSLGGMMVSLRGDADVGDVDDGCERREQAFPAAAAAAAAAVVQS